MDKYRCNMCGEFCDVVTDEWSEQYEHFGNICYQQFEEELSDCCGADVEELEDENN